MNGYFIVPVLNSFHYGHSASIILKCSIFYALTNSLLS